MKISKETQQQIDGIAEKYNIASVLVMTSHSDMMEVSASGGEKGKEIYHVGDKGKKSNHIEGEHPLYCEHVVNHDDTLIVKDAKSDPNWNQNEDLTLFNLGSYVGIPLKKDGEVVGTVCALNDKEMDLENNAKGLLEDLKSIRSEVEELNK